MKNTSILSLTNQVRRFCDQRDWSQYHSPKELAIGLTTESAELLDLFRFKSELDSQEILKRKRSRKKIENELADIFFFLLRFAQQHEIDLAEALVRKLNINRRKYPIRLTRGKNKKYTEYKR